LPRSRERKRRRCRPQDPANGTPARFSAGEAWRRARPSRRDADRPTSDRSSGRSAARLYERRRRPSPACRQAAQCGSRNGCRNARGTWFSLGSLDHSARALWALSPPEIECRKVKVPELPEVETVRRGLAPAMEGARLVKVEARRPDLRFPFPKDFAKRLAGQTVTGLGRRAKYLLADLSSGEVLLMHLGMSGSFRVEKSGESTTPGEFHYPRGEAGKHDHVVFQMSSGYTVIFNDPRRFGFMKLIPREKLDQESHLAPLGPEPLGNRFDAGTLAQSLQGKKTSLKAALSDQKVVAGLGNIYVCEALFRARLSPKRQASTIADRNGRPN